jgi:transcriptional regulator with XRE-family HTH domain
LIIGDRLKQLRESKGMSQGDIQKKTGLIRCYISRCENGHTVPAIETLEKFAHALEVPMYVLFYDGEEPPKIKMSPAKMDGWGSTGHDARTFSHFRRLLGRATHEDQKLLLHLATAMARRKKRRKAK